MNTILRSVRMSTVYHVLAPFNASNAGLPQDEYSAEIFAYNEATTNDKRQMQIDHFIEVQHVVAS